ncbi:class I SAM-dependent methyltransferase [Noviherbaspirillum denitrificans]|uniref:class I SAM-dependent methyltransferase n=1 Tax=Noviherbaspirillum denitrificans TaxID=1968433 RepID=UPI0011309795|nr:class I SAM-dependent methyltransferase [Noviherbaspirillum denitrificans]
MNFSTEWDRRYKELTHLSIWPWSDLVGYVMRHARPAGKDFRVLELGCGAGANIPFFQSLGVEYFAVEGSPAIVEKLWERFPHLKDNIAAGDFTLEIPFAGDFDLVVDRSSLTHNTSAAIIHCIEMLHARLKPGGKFIGIDWFSTAYSEYQRGLAAEDAYTRTGYQDGSFADVGRVHFSDKPHLLELFKGFEMLVMEHKTIQRELPDSGWHFASWNFVAKKP